MPDTPPHRSVRAELPHTAPILDEWRRNECRWRAVASAYFKSMPVPGALDANGDFVISPGEIRAAPSALRRLDLNHDGKLSPEECGFSLNPRSRDAPDAEIAMQAQKEFMRAHPVLAALDADHDGEISAEEIGNSSRYLRTLDRDGDGFLTPNEVMPVGSPH